MQPARSGIAEPIASDPLIRFVLLICNALSKTPLPKIAAKTNITTVKTKRAHPTFSFVVHFFEDGETGAAELDPAAEFLESSASSGGGGIEQQQGQIVAPIVRNKLIRPLF
jgi:hypothetical protein